MGMVVKEKMRCHLKENPRSEATSGIIRESNSWAEALPLKYNSY